MNSMMLMFLGMLIGAASMIWCGYKLTKTQEKPRMVTWVELVGRASTDPDFAKLDLATEASHSEVRRLVVAVYGRAWAQGWISGVKAGLAGQRYAG